MAKMLHMAAYRAIGICLLFLIGGFGVSQAQTAKHVTIRDLNNYTSLTSQDGIANQYYADSLVTITAVISSYPKDSGLAAYHSDTGEIDRIHIFVIDTAAASMGRDGMSIQVVEDNNYKLLEDLRRGDVVDITGKLTFFETTAQFAKVEKVTNLTVDLNQTQIDRYNKLIQPEEVTVADLNQANGDGTMQLNLSNYSKYVGGYVKIKNATVVNVSLGDRPNWALKQGNNLIYIYDTSLRMRNDKSTYRDGYNYRHGEDPTFEPPAAGSVVNVSGYLTLNSDDPDGLNASGLNSFTINPFDDGYVWLGGTRYADGDPYAGSTLSWPNDIEVVGSPPSFSNYTISDHTPTSTDQVTVSVDVTPNNGATLTDVNLIYKDGTDTVSVAMNNSGGSTYTYTFPAFSNFTSVLFHIEATDDQGLTGTYPQGSEDSFIVLDQKINSISTIQKTADEMPGPSPLAGLGELPMNITAWVVADSADGYIAIQDSKNPWSGIFLNAGVGGVRSLKRGDKITITKGTVTEYYSVTYLAVNEMTVDASGQDISGLIPDLLTQDITNAPAKGEPYEGMLLKFNDVKITTNQADYPSDHGEFEIGSRQGGGAADTVKTYQGLRIDDGTNDYGTSPNLTSDLNENIRIGAQIQSVTGALWYSYYNYKLIMRSLNDIVSTQWTTPKRNIKLLNPTNGSNVTADHDLVVQWQRSIDYDGNKVHYIWALSTPKDTTFKSTFVMMNSDNNGEDPTITLSYQTVDNLLSTAGLQVGQSVDLIWTVLMTDGVDTVQTSTYSAPDFTPTYNSVNLTRANETAIDNDNVLPHKFALKQNYPNPFNPTTTINYSIPHSVKVRLTIYDVLGRRVAMLVNKVQNAGNYHITFDARQLSSGMYFYRLETPNRVITRKMMLIK